MRFAERLKKVVRDNFVDIAGPEVETVQPSAIPDPAYENVPIFAAQSATENKVGGHEANHDVAFFAPPAAEVREAEVEFYQAAEPNADAVVSPSGDVDFDLLFINAAPPRFTAEEAARLVAALPLDLPLRVKRLTVKASVESLAKREGVTPAEAIQSIVGDAAHKMLHLARLQEAIEEQLIAEKAREAEAFVALQAQNARDLEAFRVQNDEETESFCSETEKEVGDLEALIADWEAQIAQLQARIAGAQENLVEKARLLDSVAAQNEARLATQADAQAILLQAEANAQVERLERAEKRREAVRRACKVRMNALNDVVLFFDEAAMDVGGSGAPIAADTAAATDENELPPFMREDTALKLLGIAKNRAAQTTAAN